MKKLTLLLWICLVSVVQSVYSQNINSARVTYSVEKTLPPDYLKRINDNFTLSENSKETLINSYHLNKSVHAILEFNKNESFYKASKRDTDKQRNKTLRGLNFSFILAVGSYYKYYSNTLENIQFYKAQNLGGQFELVYFEKHKWKLVDGNTNILGYSCKKAIKINENKKSKNETIVWYTEKIPFSFGPKDYSGLPGLILKIEKGNDTFLATKIEINPQELKLRKPTAKLKTTLKEKRKAFQKLMDENK